MHVRVRQGHQTSASSTTPVQTGILQRKCAHGKSTQGGSQCEECAKKNTGLQRKLAIGASNDPLEQEADRIAEQVMAGSSTSGAQARPLAPALQRDTGPGFGHNFSKVRVHSSAAAYDDVVPATPVEANPIRISQPNDPAEIEADQIADRVMRMSVDDAKQKSNVPTSPNAIHRKCDACEEVEDEVIETPVMRKEAFVSATPTQPGDRTPHHVRSAINSGGSPLDMSTRSFFEPRFGHDLSDVRIHTDATAGQSARTIDARAYTLGSNIVFAAGEYAPATERGKRLLAHELAHTVQELPSGISHRQTLDDPDLPDMPRPGRPQPRSGGVPPMPAIKPINEPAEPQCPRLPTRLGNITPEPPCNEEGEDIEVGSQFMFCTDSDVLSPTSQRTQIRSFAAGQRSGTTFRVRAYASSEGPGTEAEADAYNRRLSCHRAKRIVRELINAGVPETAIDAVAMGPTEQFATGPAGRPLNRTAIIDAKPPQGITARPGNAGLDAAGVRDGAKAALSGGDYLLGADAYFVRWTCGRYRTLAEAVSRTVVQIEGVDFNGGGPELGTISEFGTNTIKLSATIMNSTDPIACAMARIADLTFHHFARPQLPAFDDQHKAGMHLVHLAGLPACAINQDPLGLTTNVVAVPRPTDPFADRAPGCADRPLEGPLTPGRGPASQDLPPTFILDPIQVLTNSGSVGPGLSNPLTVGADPDAPFGLAANVIASGDPRAIADHEIGFLQTVIAERWENTHADGRRERRRFPLPLRDGPPVGDAEAAPPWFAAHARVPAVLGANAVSLTDAPNFRAFRALPDPAQSSFFKSLVIQPPGATAPSRHDIAFPTFAATHVGNAPDKGIRMLRFDTWVAARRRGAPATMQDTRFLGGLMMLYRMNVDWQPFGNSVVANGQWSLTTRAATTDESQRMILRGATGLDFVSPVTGAPLFNEFLSIDAALPINQAGGLTLNQYAATVRSLVDPNRTTPRLRGEFMVQLRVQAETGRLILDPPTASSGAVRIVPVDGEPPIPDAESLALARTIFPEVRKLVAGRISPSQPATGLFNLPIRIQAIP